MKEQTKKKLTNCILVGGIIAFILVGCYLIVYYFDYQKDECVNSPFVFGSKQMRDLTKLEFYGYGTFETPVGVESPIIRFNTTSLSINENS